MKKKYGNVLVVFQPHLFSRTKEFYGDFAKELSNADRCILLPVYPAREDPIEGVTSHLIEHELKRNGCEVEYVSNFVQLFNYFKGLTWEGVIVLMGAGDLDLKKNRIVEILKENNFEK